MSAASITPFDEGGQNTCKLFLLYTAHGAVDTVQYIDEDLARFIQHLEYSVCGKIKAGIRAPSHNVNGTHPPLKLTPRLIRTRTRQKPAPEARAWCWFMLHNNPDIALGKSRIAELYQMDYSSVRHQFAELNFAMCAPRHRKLRAALQGVADDLAGHGYASVSITERGAAL